MNLVRICLLLIFCNCGSDFSPYGDPVSVLALPVRPKPEWPLPRWKTAVPESTGVSIDGLQKINLYAYPVDQKDSKSKGIKTNALVIVRDGKIIFENYDLRYGPDHIHLTWDISKSILQTLVGITINKGLLQLEDPGYYHLSSLSRDEDHKKITIRHLLEMASGLSAMESYEFSSLNSTSMAMLYTKGRENMGEYCSSLPLKYEPGTNHYLSSCDTNILALVLKKVYDSQTYSNLPWKELFEPLGIQNATWERDRSGTFVGSSYLYLSARDLAKIGYLYLNNGVWDSKNILPNNWVNLTRTPGKVYKVSPLKPELSTYNYSLHWYVNTGVPDRGLQQPWPDSPNDVIASYGKGGHLLFVIPSLDMVVVRFGDDQDSSFDKNYFLKLIKESIVR